MQFHNTEPFFTMSLVQYVKLCLQIPFRFFFCMDTKFSLSVEAWVDVTSLRRFQR